ncbi:DUF2089 domain-containing protein [bacterium]|nr:DUF2089 domain-containing protein [candidate division CSSED10-310 bacterium]
MRYQLKSGCPACGSEMEITQYQCPQCHTSVSGNFASCKFCHLDPDMQNFITVFIIHRGNIKLVERELGISYPTVRKELQRISEALGFKVEAGGLSKSEKLTILDQLEKGAIDYDTAMAKLEGEWKEEE